MFLVPGGDEAVDFAFEFDFFVVVVAAVPFGEAGFTSGGGMLEGVAGGRGGTGDELAVLD